MRRAATAAAAAASAASKKDTSKSPTPTSPTPTSPTPTSPTPATLSTTANTKSHHYTKAAKTTTTPTTPRNDQEGAWDVHGERFGVYHASADATSTRPTRSWNPPPPPSGDRNFLAYDDAQIQLVEGRLKDIMHDAELLKVTTVEPTLQTSKAIIGIIKDLCRRKQRKIYGGVAINEYIKLKDPKLAFYDESLEIPDIDFYSPEPVADVKAICDALKAAGMSPVEAREAQHVDTFTIFAHFWKCCDVSYVPKLVYNRMPTQELPDGLQYVRPSFMFIDFLRIVNDPIMSYWRLDKNFPRFTALQKLYPLEAPIRPIDDIGAVTSEAYGADPVRNDVVRALMAEFLPGSSAVIIGMAAIHAVQDIVAARDRTSPAEVVNAKVNFNANANVKAQARVNDVHDTASMFDILTVEYASDMAKIHGIVARFVPDVKYEEYHPFYDFLGHRGQLLTADGSQILVRVFDNKYKCVPFMLLPMRMPASDEAMEVRVGSFTVLVMYMMIMRFRIRVENRSSPVDARLVHMYDTLIHRLYTMRNDYLRWHGATILDDTPFKEFVIPCVGAAMHALRINQLMQDMRFRKYHFRGFRYNPHKSTDLRVEDYKFLNTSGNIINGPRDRLFDPPRKGSSSAASRADSARTGSSRLDRATPTPRNADMSEPEPELDSDSDGF